MLCDDDDVDDDDDDDKRQIANLSDSNKLNAV